MIGLRTRLRYPPLPVDFCLFSVPNEGLAFGERVFVWHGDSDARLWLTDRQTCSRHGMLYHSIVTRSPERKVARDLLSARVTPSNGADANSKGALDFRANPLPNTGLLQSSSPRPTRPHRCLEVLNVGLPRCD
jgi:hypothetical protein